jgi:alkanesulfonate monooxygenase SsuD/methylene tetrahydromethanopterin reductase-like flavin-dependent oxidoreductase (luciferase family)
MNLPESAKFALAQAAIPAALSSIVRQDCDDDPPTLVRHLGGAVAAAHRDIVEQVLAAERGGRLGRDPGPSVPAAVFDTFALIADLLARTSRLRFFPDVANLPLRGPTMIAKAAASLDVMSGGRFELGLGAGSFWDAVAGMGGPRRTGREVADALEEAIPLIRGALDVGPDRRVVGGPGPHYPVPGYPSGPPPVHRVEI